MVCGGPESFLIAEQITLIPNSFKEKQMSHYVRHTEVWRPPPKKDDDFLGTILGGALMLFLVIAVWIFLWKWILIALGIMFVLGVIIAIMASH